MITTLPREGNSKSFLNESFKEHKRPLYQRLKEKGAVRVVQVGANDGRIADPLFPYIRNWGWGGLLIEPMPDMFAKLKALHKNRNNVILENVAVDVRKHLRPMYFCDPTKLGGHKRFVAALQSFHRSHLLGHVKEEDILKRDVECCRLSDLLDKHSITDADVLAVDVEGAEKNVFDSFEFGDFCPSLVELETRHLTENDKGFIFNRLEAAGYDIWDFGLDGIAVHETF